MIPRRHELKQGSDDWKAHRVLCDNASDAAAALNCSPYKTRDQLIAEMATGVLLEHSPEQNLMFAEGHRVEAMARAWAEKMLGEDLYPIVMDVDVEGLRRPVSASFDGLTMIDDPAFEAKMLNEELRNALPHEGADGGLLNNGLNLPKFYRVQMSQQHLVSQETTRTLFVASKWIKEGLPEELRWCWYERDPQLEREIIGAWRQAEADADAWTPRAADPPKAIGHSPETLPALVVDVTGMVTRSNLDAWEAHAMAVLGGINRKPTTDQEFADAEKVIKWCADDVEGTLKLVKQQALAKMLSVDELFKAIDRVSGAARDIRLALEKDVKREKDAIREALTSAARTEYAGFLAELNASFGTKAPILSQQARNVPMPDLDAAIKNKRTMDSLRNAINSEVAKCKIAAGDIGRVVSTNLMWLRANARDHAALFADANTIVLKAPDDLVRLATERITEAKLAEQRRMAQSEISGIQQQVIIASMGRAGVRKGGTRECITETLAETKAWPIDEDRFGTFTGMAQAAKDTAIAEIEALLVEFDAAQPVESAADVLGVKASSSGDDSGYLPVQQAAAAPAAAAPPPPAASTEEPPDMRLGDIGKLLGFSLPGAFVADVLQVPAAGRDGSAVLFRHSDYVSILRALRKRIDGLLVDAGARP